MHLKGGDKKRFLRLFFCRGKTRGVFWLKERKQHKEGVTRGKNILTGVKHPPTQILNIGVWEPFYKEPQLALPAGDVSSSPSQKSITRVIYPSPRPKKWFSKSRSKTKTFPSSTLAKLFLRKTVGEWFPHKLSGTVVENSGYLFEKWLCLPD